MSSSLQPPPLPGDTVSSYLILETLGIGGNATVYRAKSNKNTKDVALKILHPGKTTIEDIKRFKREFLSLQAIDHPNIVRVYDTGIHGEYPWIAMELVQGPDLNELIKEWEKETPQKIFEKIEQILIDICQALNYVHQQGMIHRDLKPSNVLMTKEGIAKLTDFGVVKAPEAFQSELTTMGRLVGTVAFMAPEHIMGETCDHRADLYSLGALLYMALTGKKPFESSSVAGYLSMHLTHDAPNPQTINPNIPSSLNQICIKLLQKEPAQRFSSAAEILQLLKEEISFSELIGRNALIDRFRKQIGNYQKGESIHVQIIGPPKSGKTALITRFQQELAAQGLHPVSLFDIKPGEDVIESCIVCIDDLDSRVDALEKIMTLEAQGTTIFCISASSNHNVVKHLIFEQHEIMELTPIYLNMIQSFLRKQDVVGPALIILSQRMHKLYQGNIGFCIEGLSLCIAQGWLKKTAKNKYKSAIAIEDLKKRALPIPKSLKRYLQKTLSVLSIEAKHVLECLVVFRDTISTKQITQFTNKDPSSIAQILTQLQPQWIVLENNNVTGIKSLFLPLYALLTPERKVAWHQRIASILVKNNRRNVSDCSEEIAYHLLQSNQHSTAFPFLISAAQNHFRQENIVLAKERLTQAQEILPLINEKLPLSKAKQCLFELCGYIHKQEQLLTKASNFFDKAAQQAQHLSNPTATNVLRTYQDLCLLQLGHPPTQLLFLLSQIQPSEEVWREACFHLALYYFNREEYTFAQQLMKELSRSTAAIDVSFLLFYQQLWDIYWKSDIDTITQFCSKQRCFGLDWDLFIVDGLIVLGLWEKAQHLTSVLIEESQNFINPANHCYALTLQSRICLLLGDREAAIESYNTGKLSDRSLDTPNAIRAYVSLQRLSLDLNMRVASDKAKDLQNIHLIDKPKEQMQYILARKNHASINKPQNNLPWNHIASVIDYLYSITDDALFTQELQCYWKEAKALSFPLFSLMISNIGVQKKSGEHWHQKRKEIVIHCMAKQPQQFQIREYWLNTKK